ncbi:PIG-L family deacetylase [Actinacidiphila bryophytorum]|uniref:PIG-L family deacetylase n=1 Tax=Actinacidiphila bryophytorum TaxID=1436133 RepID=UPI002176E9C0|nr:PIG-L family deacetylase [Actinacidiphila bryophytorum]UWE12775.1 PIG-L family deacetylase [Actinacidiphila bryophytorum]
MALGGAGCRGGAHTAAVKVAPAPVAGPYRRESGALVMQVLAHPDDDLYFMNPDTLHDLQAGTPVVSVYVTAGESRGWNTPPGGSHRHHHADQAAYSAARHQGLRQAYATMLGLPHFTRWHGEVLDLPGGMHAQIDSLSSGARRASLVFLQVSMHELSQTASMQMLWSTPGTTLPYVAALDSPAPANAPGTYSHDKLVDVLVALLKRYAPTHVRTLDPDPDIQVHDKQHPRDSDQFGYSDHRDHTPVALFAWKALARWAASGGRGFTTAAYRGYYNQRWPFNLPPATVALKGRFMFQYGGDPDWSCGDPGGCGDYGQGRNQPLTNRKGWIRSTHPRYPGAGQVVVPAAAAGAPRTAYEVLGLHAAVRTETAPGSGRWGPAKDLGGGPLTPKLACVAVPGGTLVFGLRFAALEGHGGRNARDVVVRDVARDGSGRWTSLGTPERSDNLSRRVGPPAAVRTADGRVHLFVRNADKGLSTRVREPGGAWGPWADLGGSEVQEGLSVLADGQGRVHVFAAGRDTVHHWAQAMPFAPVTFRPSTGLPCPSDLPSATLAPDGAITLTYRRPASAVTLRETVAT